MLVWVGVGATFGGAGSKWQLRAKPKQTQALPTKSLALKRGGFALFLFKPTEAKLP